MTYLASHAVETARTALPAGTATRTARQQAQPANENMDKSRIIEYPDPHTGKWVRGYMGDNGEMVRVDGEDEGEGIATMPPKPGKTPKKAARKVDSGEDGKLTIRMTKDELRRYRNFCMWYSLVFAPTSITAMTRSLIEANYRKHPAFGEFEKSITGK